MPVLKNQRHERFCQEVAKGSTAIDAYKAAGYKPDRGAATRLSAKVSHRVSEILIAAGNRVEINQARVLEELGRIGFSNMLDYITVQKDGSAIVDLSALDREKAAAIQEITVDSYEQHDPNSEDEKKTVTVKKIKFKLSDKRAALVDIGKHLGLFKDDGRAGENAKDVTPTTPERDLARRMAYLLDKSVSQPLKVIQGGKKVA